MQGNGQNILVNIYEAEMQGIKQVHSAVEETGAKWYKKNSITQKYILIIHPIQNLISEGLN